MVWLFGVTLAAQATEITSAGGGSEATPWWWGNGTSWLGGTVPTLDGTDDAIVDGGGMQKQWAFDITGGSSLILTDNAYFRQYASNAENTELNNGVLTIDSGKMDVEQLDVRGGSTIEIGAGGWLRQNNDASGTTTPGVRIYGGSQVTVHAGGLLENLGHFVYNGASSRYNIAGGTLLVSGPSNNSVGRWGTVTDAGVNFTGVGGKLQMDQYSGTDTLSDHFLTKATTGFFMINGTYVTGFGAEHAIEGLYLEVYSSNDDTDAGTLDSGSVTLYLPSSGTVFIFR